VEPLIGTKTTQLTLASLPSLLTLMTWAFQEVANQAPIKNYMDIMIGLISNMTFAALETLSMEFISHQPKLLK
jgi:hypothetical protein